jgi:flagella basal body P-ring formation protein FlgA
MIRSSWLPALCLALAVVPGLARAQQSLEKVRTAAEQSVLDQQTLPGTRVQARADALDDRLRLAACVQPLKASLPPGRPVGSRVSVVVQCPDQAGWTLRVPVRVQVYQKVLVTSRPMARGDGIGAGDVHTEERDTASLSYGFVTELAQIDGRALARPLNSGTVLAPGMLAGRQSIRLGDAVVLTSKIDGVIVRADGVALGAGDNGSRLRVRNTSSGRILDAVVRGEGVVEVMP